MDVVDAGRSRTDSDSSSYRSVDEGTSKFVRSRGSGSTKKMKVGNMGIELSPGFLDLRQCEPMQQHSESPNILQGRRTNQISSKAGSEFLDASPSSSSLNKLSSVGCSKMENAQLVNKMEGQRKKYCMPCIGKWVSDISELENFNISKLITYLRTEFQSVHFKKTEEKLRVLEEEGEMQSKEMSKHAEYLEEELRASKDKCSELSLKLWKAESSKTDVEVDLKNYKVTCEELREKVFHLENVIADKDKELIELKTSNRDLEHFKKSHISDNTILELELEPDICLNQYLQQFRNASKMEKKTHRGDEIVKVKPKSKALVEIEARDSPEPQKRSRKSGGYVVDEEMKKKKKRKINHEGLDELVSAKTKNKDIEEISAAKNETLEEKKKKKKRKCEALGKHALGTKERAVEDAVKAKIEFLIKPCKTEKSSCKILDTKVVKGLSSAKINSMGSGSCHQCKRVDRGKIFSCMDCKRRYCLLCIQKRYPQMSHGEIEKSCPVCRGNCNCSACLRKKGKSKVKLGSKHGT